MRWHTANKRKRRALARQRVRQQYPVYPFHVLLKPPFFALNWRAWLDKLLPDLMFQNQINENSIFNRLMQPHQYSTYETIRLPTLQRSGSYQTAEGAPVFPVSPNRLEVIWQNIWIGQGCKCADCGEPVELEQSCKRSRSFQIVCRKCREKVPMVMIVDDIDYPDPPPLDVRVKYWDIVPNPGDLRFPMPPRHTKEFIYGDNWVAYKRIRPAV